MADLRARVMALYLPQFHPIPENDAWWGDGFTEWTNVVAARPMFRGHDQPRLPGELGFYDLRVPEVRQAQAALAAAYGVEAFCYWHYWFAGDRLLERPFAEVLSSGRPNFPFCLSWANHSWQGTWYGAGSAMLKEQTYPGEDDERAHFEVLLPAFQDRRYVRVDGKPLFFVFKPWEIPDPAGFARHWRALARAAGLPGLFLVGFAEDENWSPQAAGWDGALLTGLGAAMRQRIRLSTRLCRRLAKVPAIPAKLRSRLSRRPVRVHRYADVVSGLLPSRPLAEHEFPSVVPNWDNTPRSKSDGFVLTGCSPEAFGRHLRTAIDLVHHRAPDRRLIMLKSWNEWAEGNYVEPDQRSGRGYLEAMLSALTDPQFRGAAASLSTLESSVP